MRLPYNKSGHLHAETHEMMELHDELEAVADAASFLAFVRALIADRRGEIGETVDDFGRGVRGWENHSIEDFLEAALSWAESTDVGASHGLSEASTWKRFATFLYCGKIYE